MNKIGNLIEIEWLNELNDLQPENAKVPYNLDHLKKSILKYGFAVPFAVWNDNGTYYTIDGHTRKQVLTELMAEGHKVPKKLKAYEIEAKDRKEAIKILTEVYNQKHNPFAEEVLLEWLEVEEIPIEDINIESVNVKIFQEFSPEIDYSLLEDNEELDNILKDMANGVKKAIQIEFEAEHYEEAFALVKFWREQGGYVGGMIMEFLKAEKEKI